MKVLTAFHSASVEFRTAFPVRPSRDPSIAPPAAQERIERLLDRLELVLKQIKTVEAARDAVVKKSSAQDESERMIRDLVQQCGIGAESATLLVREAFCRDFANRRSLGAYAGLTGTPFASGGMQREQGISNQAQEVSPRCSLRSR